MLGWIKRLLEINLEIKCVISDDLPIILYNFIYKLKRKYMNLKNTYKNTVTRIALNWLLIVAFSFL